MPKVLFVCLGNICRSPLGEGILRKKALESGISIEIDSAGTGDWHVGQLPDRRSIKVGAENGCDMTMRARQVRSTDFRDFDYIIAMDHANVRDLAGWAGSDPDRIRLAMSFTQNTQTPEVPDPYYGEYSDFENVYALLDEACDGILAEIATRQTI